MPVVNLSCLLASSSNYLWNVLGWEKSCGNYRNKAKCFGSADNHFNFNLYYDNYRKDMGMAQEKLFRVCINIRKNCGSNPDNYIFNLLKNFIRT